MKHFNRATHVCCACLVSILVFGARTEESLGGHILWNVRNNTDPAIDWWASSTNWDTEPGNTPHVYPGPADEAALTNANVTLNITAEINAGEIGANAGLGHGGDALLTIDSGGHLLVSGLGGTVTGTNANGDLVLGVESTRAGLVVVNGSGQITVANNLTLNLAGTGTSSITLNGASSSLSVTGLTEVSKTGTGQIIVNDGTAAFGGGLKLTNSNARLFADGGTVNVTGGLQFGNDSARLEANAGSIVNVDAITTTGLGQLHLNGGVFNLAGNTIDVQSVRLGYLAGTTASYTLGAGKTIINEGDVAIGDSGTGTLTVDGAGASIDTRVLFVGLQDAGNGTLNLLEGTISATGGADVAGNGTGDSGTTGSVTIGKVGGGLTDAVLNSTGANFELGNGGTAVLTQESGTVNVNGSNLVMAQGADSSATYHLNGGALNIVNDLNIANRGIAVFNQNAGTVTIGSDLQLAANSASDAAGADGTYNMNGGILNVGDTASEDLRIGANRLGKFNQNLGTTTVAGNVEFGSNSATGNGTLSINGGLLTATEITTGAGVGTLNINDGTALNVTTGNIELTNLNVGVTASTAYTQTAGLVDVGTLTLGNGAFSGTYNVSGGTLQVNQVTTGSPGIVNINTGGTFQVTPNVNPAAAGASSLSQFNVNGGTFVVTVGPFAQLTTTDAAFTGGFFDVDHSQVVSGSSTGTASQTTWIGGTGTWTDASHAEWDLGSSAGWTIAAGGAIAVVNSTNASTGVGSGLVASGQAATDGWSFDYTGDPNNATIVNGSTAIVSGPVRAVIEAAGQTITRNDVLRVANEAGAGAAQVQFQDGNLVLHDELVFGGDADGTFDQNGGTVTINSNLRFGPTASSPQGGTYNLNAGTLTVNGDIVESDASVDSAQFQINGGSLQITGSILVQRFSVGETGAGSYAHDNGQTLQTTGTLNVGDRAVGTFVIDGGGSGGSAVTASNMTVGDKDGSAGTTMTLQNVASLTVNGQTDVGDFEGGAGAIYVRGGSTWTNNGTVVLGGADTSSGTIHLEEGRLDQTSGNFYVAGDGSGNTGTSGMVVVGQAGETDHAKAVLNSTNGNVEVGRGGTGTLTQHSGTVNVHGSNLVVGQYAGSVGSYTLNDGILSLANDFNINAGQGSFTQTGGAVTLSGNLNLSDAATGSATLQLNGGAFSIAGNLDYRAGGADTVGLSGTGTLDMTGGNIIMRNASDQFSFTGGTLRNVGTFGVGTWVADSSSAQRDGLAANIDAGTAVVAGKVGNAVQFGAALADDAYVSMGDADMFDGDNAFSISMWFNRAADNQGSHNAGLGTLSPASNHEINNVMVAQSSNPSNDNFEIGTDGNKIEGYLDVDGSGPNQAGGTETFSVDLGAGAITDGTWHQIVLTYEDADGAGGNPGVLDVWFDGANVLDGDTSFDGVLASSSSSALTLGIARGGDQNWGDFSGLLDQVAFWEGLAISDAEIGELWNSGAGNASASALTTASMLLDLDAMAVDDLVQQGGRLAPGTAAGTDGVGTMLLNAGYDASAGAIYEIEVDGLGSNDFLDIVGNATLEDGFILDVLFAGYGPEIGDVFQVMTAADIDVDLNALIVRSDYGGLIPEIILGGNGEILQLTYVPEPGTFLLLGLGGLATVALARRKRRSRSEFDHRETRRRAGIAL